MKLHSLMRRGAKFLLQIYVELPKIKFNHHTYSCRDSYYHLRIKYKYSNLWLVCFLMKQRSHYSVYTIRMHFHNMSLALNREDKYSAYCSGNYCNL